MSTGFLTLAFILTQESGNVAAQPSWSLTQIIASAIIGLVSLITGGLIQKWLMRGRPSLQITSIGFSGSSEFIKIDDTLITQTEKDSYGETLRKYEPFSVLKSRQRQSAEYIERLRAAIPLCEEWIEKAAGSNPATCLNLGALKRHPYMLDDIVRTVLIGMCRRGEIGAPPLSIGDIANYHIVAPLSEASGGKDLHVSLGRFGVIFPSEQMPNDLRKADLRLLAESFSKGVAENLHFYTTRFVEQSTADSLLLRELTQTLERAMLPNAHISVVASIYNVGGGAITLRPHLGLRILHNDLRDTTFILSHTPGPSNPQGAVRAAPEDSTQRGRHVVVQPFLPETTSAPYISIAPGQAYEARLLATAPLGEKPGKSLMKIYDTSLLRCQIVAITVSGQAVWSTPSVFSGAVTDASRNEIESLVKGK